MILHIPHASRTIPADVRRTLLLTDDELERELRHMTDLWTDELFSGSAGKHDRIIVYPVSRLVVDPERFEDDDLEPMAEQGMGAVYVRTSSGMRLRASLTALERDMLLRDYYRPHHERLEHAVAEELAATGKAVIIDCHSFPSTPLPYEPNQSQTRPEICVGTDDIHTPEPLRNAALRSFRAKGYCVELNTPFSGSLVPQRWYRSDPSVHSIMVEVRRDLYLDESNGDRLPRFDAVRDDLEDVLVEIAKIALPDSPRE